MSRISENIRKITKAWGGKTTGNGISDALSDLYNNLPFGTKTEMVAILPEQSVTGHAIGNGWYGSLFPTEISLVEGKEYTIVINGEKRKATLRDISEEWGYESGIGFDDLYIFDDEGWGADWSGTLGETVTLAIYEEKEIVEQIDPKFVGDFVVKFSIEPSTGEWIADKTVPEIVKAFKDGVRIIGKKIYEDGDWEDCTIYYPYSINGDTNEGNCHFINVSGGNGFMHITSIDYLNERMLVQTTKITGTTTIKYDSEGGSV